jgi:hypothetical protein
VEHLVAGGRVALAIATSATVEADGQEPSVLPLTRKTARVLAEHAALALEYLRNETTVVNRDTGAEVKE